MNAVFTIDGLPELNARLDKIAVVVANPITREALAAGGKVIKDKSRGAGAPAHKGFAQQLQAVTRAERTGQIDPRLTGVFGDFDERGQFQAAGRCHYRSRERQPANCSECPEDSGHRPIMEKS